MGVKRVPGRYLHHVSKRILPRFYLNLGRRKLVPNLILRKIYLFRSLHSVIRDVTYSKLEAQGQVNTKNKIKNRCPLASRGAATVNIRFRSSVL